MNWLTKLFAKNYKWIEFNDPIGGYDFPVFYSDVIDMYKIKEWDTRDKWLTRHEYIELRNKIIKQNEN